MGILGAIKGGWDDIVGKGKEFINDWQDYGLAAAIDDDIKEDKMNTEASDNYDDKKLLVTVGTGIGGAVLGAKLGERFGAIGKIGGAIAGAWITPKFVNGIAEDVTGTIDYVNKCERNGQEANFLKTLGSNILDVKGQEYTGDSDIPDM